MKAQILLQDAFSQQWLLFERPSAIVTATEVAEVCRGLDAVSTSVERDGLVAAGFISYEAAPAFDSSLKVRRTSGLPLLWFALFEEAREIAAPTAGQPFSLDPWQPTLTREEYERQIRRIKAYIAEGDTYQVNFTYRLRSQFGGDAPSFFARLVEAQNPQFGAYIDTGRHVICSASPELFFSLDGNRLKARPMKGTIERGRTLQEDSAKAEMLARSIKDQAENVMIVDMVRNDMGRIARTGTVSVTSLFEIEKYPTLWQMTSTVTSDSDQPLTAIMQALFPCASITGAPKVRTMEIIGEVESTPRGVYTGAIGYLGPGRKAQFNVAIRTVVINSASGRAEYGVGGGIVWDSTAEKEYQESQTKALILLKPRPAFRLLESMRWTPEEGFWLLEEHLSRLEESASYFDYRFDRGAIEAELAELALGLAGEAQRIRLMLGQDGTIQLEAESYMPPAKYILGLARGPVDSNDLFLYHKTTHREIYEMAKAERPDCDDVLLWNERNEITESTIANVVVELEGELLTPPLSCGLLGGTHRKSLLAQGRLREQVVFRRDLERARKIYLVNSLRGWIEPIYIG